MSGLRGSASESGVKTAWKLIALGLKNGRLESALRRPEFCKRSLASRTKRSLASKAEYFFFSAQCRFRTVSLSLCLAAFGFAGANLGGATLAAG